jgi:nucleoside-diphosphate-sugar epimerase
MRGKEQCCLHQSTLTHPSTFSLPHHSSLGHPHFTLVNHDVVEPIMLEVDQVYHLACPASPPHYQYNPIKTIKTNTQVHATRRVRSAQFAYPHIYVFVLPSVDEVPYL